MMRDTRPAPMPFDEFEDDIYIGDNVVRDTHAVMLQSHVRELLIQLHTRDIAPAIIGACIKCTTLVSTEEQINSIQPAQQVALTTELVFHLQSSDSRVAGAAALALRPLLATRRGLKLVLYPESNAEQYQARHLGSEPNQGICAPMPVLPSAEVSPITIRPLFAALVRLLELPALVTERLGTKAAAECLTLVLEDQKAAKHLYSMPETTFGSLVERLLKIMDVHPHGQDIFLCVLAGKAFQQVVRGCTERILQSPRFPEILGSLSLKIASAKEAMDAVGSAALMAGTAPPTLVDEVECAAGLAKECAYVLAEATKTPEGTTKVLMYHPDPVGLVDSLLKGIALYPWPDTARAISVILDRIMEARTTVQWILTLPEQKVARMVAEVVTLINNENAVTRTTALRVCASIACYAPQLPPVLRAPANEALVLINLLCEMLMDNIQAFEMAVVVRLLAGLTGFHDKAGAHAREWILDRGAPARLHPHTLVIQLCRIALQSFELAVVSDAAVLLGNLLCSEEGDFILEDALKPSEEASAWNLFGMMSSGNKELSDTLRHTLFTGLNFNLPTALEACAEIVNRITRMHGGGEWLIAGEGHVSPPVLFASLLAAAKVSPSDRNDKMLERPAHDIYQDTPTTSIQRIQNSFGGLVNPNYDERPMNRDLGSSNMNQLAAALGRAELNDKMATEAARTEERLARGNNAGKGWGSDTQACALWNGPATKHFKGSTGVVAEALRRLLENHTVRWYLTKERGPAARAAMCGLARLLQHRNGTADALLGFTFFTDAPEVGLALLSLLSRGEGGDLENLMVRLQTLRVSPEPNVGPVAGMVLDHLQNFLHGSVPPTQPSGPRLGQPGAVWNI